LVNQERKKKKQSFILIRGKKKGTEDFRPAREGVGPGNPRLMCREKEARARFSRSNLEEKEVQASRHKEMGKGRKAILDHRKKMAPDKGATPKKVQKR